MVLTERSLAPPLARRRPDHASGWSRPDRGTASRSTDAASCGAAFTLRDAVVTPDVDPRVRPRRRRSGRARPARRRAAPPRRRCRASPASRDQLVEDLDRAARPSGPRPTARRESSTSARRDRRRRPSSAERRAPCAAAWRRAAVPGGRSGCPSVTLARPFSAALMSSQLAMTAPAVGALTSPKTCGWRPTSLSCTPPGDVGHAEPPVLGGQSGVEEDLEQEVAQLLFEMGGGRRRPRGPPVVGALGHLGDGVQDLVGLLDQVAGERGVGLLAVPRAALAQGADQLLEPRPSRPPPGRRGGSIHTEVRWSGSTARSRSAQGTTVTVSSARPRWCSTTAGRARARRRRSRA